jgi:hypothetical protein
MNRNTITAGVALLFAVISSAQSGIIEGPFVPGTGTYTTVPGGTFEPSDPLTGWGDYLNIATIIPVTTPTQRGDQVGKLSGWSNGWYAVNKSLDNSLIVGQSYVLSGFFRADNEGGSIAADIGNFAGQFWAGEANFALAANASTVGKWYFGYVTFTANNPTMRVRLVRNGPTTTFASSYFDDVAVTPAAEFVAPTPVPEPATLLGLGAALWGLRAKGSRRKHGS